MDAHDDEGKRMSAALPRELTEEEKWTRPFTDSFHGTIRVRITCEHGWPTRYCCARNATVKVGRRKVCRQHASPVSSPAEGAASDA